MQIVYYCGCHIGSSEAHTASGSVQKPKEKKSRAAVTEIHQNPSSGDSFMHGI